MPDDEARIELAFERPAEPYDHALQAWEPIDQIAGNALVPRNPVLRADGGPPAQQRFPLIDSPGSNVFRNSHGKLRYLFIGSGDTRRPDGTVAALRMLFPSTFGNQPFASVDVHHM
jgi:hypothetical protein